jgi:hypothetical protein
VSLFFTPHHATYPKNETDEKISQKKPTGQSVWPKNLFFSKKIHGFQISLNIRVRLKIFDKNSIYSKYKVDWNI